MAGTAGTAARQLTLALCLLHFCPPAFSHFFIVFLVLFCLSYAFSPYTFTLFYWPAAADLGDLMW